PAGKESAQTPDSADAHEVTYVLNTKTKKFHKPSCSSLPTTNRKDSSESRASIVAQGYEPCKKCNP
ncbi:MAG: MBL fold metallo-hydrolase, partial [Lachnospiraceae bacterium]|nr:MBL fold metallo-hydrolase [Lachnospiraceae bacterium]